MDQTAPSHPFDSYMDEIDIDDINLIEWVRKKLGPKERKGLA